MRYAPKQNTNQSLFFGEDTETGEDVLIWRENSVSTEADKRASERLALLQEDLSPFIVPPLNIELSEGATLAMVSPDGVALSELLSKTKLKLSDFTKFADQLVGAIQTLHSRRIAHGHIQAAAIFVNPERRTLSLALHPDCLTRPTGWPAGIGDREVVALNYCAPEQSDRTQATPDLRADLYALGVVFFEMLTGALPFRSLDRLELLHQHLATQPPDVRTIRPDTPAALAGVVAKLLKKAPEDRYQSAYGLLMDLRRCRDCIDAGQTGFDFVLGERDAQAIFRPEDKLYGREAEVEQIAAEAERVMEGGSGLVFLRGRSGFGKSAIAEQLRDLRHSDQEPIFISGAYQEFQNTPYSGLRDALKELMFRKTAEGPTALQNFSQHLQDSVGNNLALVADWLPGLRAKIEVDDDADTVDPIERNQRFRIAALNLLEALSSQDAPIILFLDDLQWADSASLALIEEALQSGSLSHMLVVGAFRDDDPELVARMDQFMDGQQVTGLAPILIEVGPLSIEAASAMIREAMHLPPEADVSELSAVVHARSQGNAFHLRRLLTALHEEGAIRFDLKSAQWIWRMDAVTESVVDVGVAQLMTERLERLGPDRLETLRFAACFGSSFDANDLQTISPAPMVEIEQHLAEAWADGLITPTRGQDNSYRFSHDMVREAAYALSPKGERELLHYRIGANLIGDISDLSKDDRLFSALDHISLGAGLVSKPAIGQQIAAGVFCAIERAKGVAAYDVALRHLRLLEGLPPGVSGVGWTEFPAAAERLRTEAMEIVFMTNGFEEAKPYFDELSEKLDDERAMARVHQILVTLFTSRSEYERALEYGVAGLKLLGENLKGSPGPKIMGQLIATRLEMRKHDSDDFSSLPDMSDDKSAQTIEMLMTLSTPAFLQNKDLFVLISLRMFRITLRDGLTSEGLLSIHNYAITNYIAFKAIDTSYKSSENLFPLLAARNISPMVRGRLIYTFAIVMAWHFRRYDDLEEMLTDGIRFSWQAADILYVGYYYYSLLKFRWMMCKPLTDLSAQLGDFERYRRRLGNEVLDSITLLYRRAITRLTVEDGRWTDEDRRLEEQMVGDSSIGTFLITQSLLTFVFEDWRMVRELFDKLSAQQEFATVGPEFPDYHLLSALHLTRAPETALPLTPSKRKRRIKKHAAALKRLAEKYPTNHRHHHLILSGEIARLGGDHEAALAAYADAGRAASDTGIWSYAGLANEFAAAAAEEQNDGTRRDEFLLAAHNAYGGWGATAKQRLLEQRAPDLFGRPSPQSERQERSGLDLATIIKASQAILEVTDVSTLLKRLMQIAMENAGADFGELYLVHNEDLRLSATARIEGADVVVEVDDAGTTLDSLSPSDHPREIVSSVAASKASVILSEASTSMRYRNLAYVQAKTPRSVMCLPVASSGALIAVLYLENSLIEGAFTADRRETLSTITSLAAVSITNTLLYARQEEALEVEKQAAVELTRINRLKDEFLANTSHELRTPLNGIIGLADSMVDGASGALTDETAKTLGLIASSGRRLSGLVNDILDFARLKDGEMALDMRPVDIRGLVDVVFALMGAKAAESSVTLTNDIPAELTNVIADKNRLQQILINLVDNAMKFTTDHVTVGLAVVGGRANVSVADNGEGIPLEAQSRIFDSFEQADASIQRRHGGVGLGLAISNSLVRLHGGSIRVDSEPGKGAKFTFDLEATKEAAENTSAQTIAKIRAPQEPTSTPYNQQALYQPAEFDSIDAKPGKTKPPSPGKDEKVYRALAVDDDPVNLKVLQNYMRIEGFEVELAHDGAEALKLMDNGFDPDIVLLDIMMPRMSGYEVCRQIREKHAPARLPIVMLTAKNQVEDLRTGFEAGATDFLTKPFSREELSARMRSHISLAQVSSAYERFVPHEFLDFLKRDSILEISLGDNAARQMSVMFTDIRSYTSIVEALTPAESFHFLNSYFARMGPIVHENNGIVNQYLGDGMMSLFPNTPEDAVNAAIGIQRELRRFNADRKIRDLPPIGTGIGIHTGNLIMGILGDKFRRSGNVVADTVNLAARVEGLTKQYGVSIAISEQVIDTLPNPDAYAHRRLDIVRVVGLQKPISIYDLFAGDTAESIELKLASKNAFEKAGEHLRESRFSEAHEIFQNIYEQNPDDSAAKYLAQRAHHRELNGAPEDWDGIENLTKK